MSPFTMLDQAHGIMSEPATVMIFGPVDGYYAWSRKQHSRRTHVSERQNVRDAVVKVGAAVDMLITTTIDWRDRSDAERRAALEGVKSAGAELLLAVAPCDQERKELLALLDGAKQISLSTTEHVPWEWLYLGDSSLPCDPTQFLGSNRLIMVPDSQTPIMPGSTDPDPEWDSFAKYRPRSHKLTVNMAEDDRLPSARCGRERGIFYNHSAKPEFNLLDAFPAPHASRQMEKFYEFANGLYDVMHYNCHAANDSIFVSRRFEVTVANLTDGKYSISSAAAVVLNCCGGFSTQYFLGKNTVAHAFALRGAKAVVATTGRIEDAYATGFARSFYDKFLEGISIGQSLLWARQKTIAETGNPACLVYALLGPFVHQILPAASE